MALSVVAETQTAGLPSIRPPAPPTPPQPQPQTVSQQQSGNVLAQQAAQLLEANGLPFTAENMNRALGAIVTRSGGELGGLSTGAGAGAVGLPNPPIPGQRPDAGGSSDASDIIGDQIGDVQTPTAPPAAAASTSPATLPQPEPELAGIMGSSGAPPELPIQRTRPPAQDAGVGVGDGGGGGIPNPPIPQQRPDDQILATMLSRRIMQEPQENRAQMLQALAQLRPELMPFVQQALEQMAQGLESGVTTPENVFAR